LKLPGGDDLGKKRSSGGFTLTCAAIVGYLWLRVCPAPRNLFLWSARRTSLASCDNARHRYQL